MNLQTRPPRAWNLRAPALAAALAIALAGCGDDDSPAAAPTNTPTLAATHTRTPTEPPPSTPTSTATSTRTPTSTATPSATASPSATNTPSPTPTPTLAELAAAEDNGALGRNPFNNPAHIAPVDACADTVRATDQSLVIRALPQGPTALDGTLLFTSGVCIYLPPGYVESRLAYPVLYLLHGGGGDQANWITFGGLQSIMDGAIAADPANAAIVVMPDGSNAQWYDSFDGSLAVERYVLDFLIPYVDRRFRTIAERGGRVIDGLSNGGYGSMLFAAKAPDQFIAAGAMSANFAGLSFPGLGDAATAPAYRHGNLPLDLAANLNGLDLTLDIGTECISDRPRDNCLAWTFEQIFVPANREFASALAALRGPDDGTYEYREGEGAHAWNWWSLWLRERHLPFFLARLADPRPVDVPAGAPTPRPGFNYRSIASQFSVWGYDVSVARPVREFLELRDVTAGGFTVQGSGTAVIRTAALYTPQRRYNAYGTGPADNIVIADAAGHLSITVDLGPAHEHEQYSPEATALEAAGGYWTVRTVAIGAEP